MKLLIVLISLIFVGCSESDADYSPEEVAAAQAIVDRIPPNLSKYLRQAKGGPKVGIKPLKAEFVNGNLIVHAAFCDGKCNSGDSFSNVSPIYDIALMRIEDVSIFASSGDAIAVIVQCVDGEKCIEDVHDPSSRYRKESYKVFCKGTDSCSDLEGHFNTLIAIAKHAEKSVPEPRRAASDGDRPTKVAAKSVSDPSANAQAVADLITPNLVDYESVLEDDSRWEIRPFKTEFVDGKLVIQAEFCREGQTCLGTSNIKTLYTFMLKSIDNVSTFGLANFGRVTIKCVDGEKCVESSNDPATISRSDSISIDCKGTDACEEIVRHLNSLIAFAKQGQEPVLEPEQADPPDRVTSIEDAQAAAKRINENLSGNAYNVDSDGEKIATIEPKAVRFNDGIFYVDASICDERNSDPDVPSSCFFVERRVHQVSLDQLDPNAFEVNGSGEKLVVVFHCHAGTRCITYNTVGIVTDRPQSSALITCKSDRACQETIADLKTLISFAAGSDDNPPDVPALADGNELVGVWELQNAVLPGWVTEYHADGTYTFTNPQTVATGTYEAVNGQFTNRSDLPGVPDFVGTYAVFNGDTLVLEGMGGRTVWKRKQ